VETFGAQPKATVDQSLPGLEPVSLRFVIDPSWWKANFRCAYRFAPQCIAGAVVLTIANVAMISGNFIIQQRMFAMQAMTQASIGDAITILVICLISLIVGMTTTLWAAGVWLIRLTTFARAYKLYGPECTVAQFEAAGNEVKARKSYLARFWLLGSGYLLVPVIPFACLVSLRMFTRPEWTVNGETLIPLPPGLSVQMIDQMVTWVGSVLLLVTFAYSCVAICFAALSPGSPFRSATKSLQQCLSNPLPVLAIALIVGLINLILTSPLGLVAMLADPRLLERDLWYAIATQVWLGVTSTVVWTASIAPFCMITSAPVMSSNNDEQ